MLGTELYPHALAFRRHVAVVILVSYIVVSLRDGESEPFFSSPTLSWIVCLATSDSQD